jgi:class 3 adenylate cyclase
MRSTIEEFLTGSRRAHPRNRMLATVLLAEIVDSTKLAAELGDRRWRGLVNRHQALLRKELSRFRGREAAGDRYVATFDGPIRALRCALSLRDGSRQLGLEIRSGVHTGECELKGDRLHGIAASIAAQVLARAEPGEIWVSGTTKNLIAGSGIEFRDRGSYVLEDLPGQWPLFTVE